MCTAQVCYLLTAVTLSHTFTANEVPACCYARQKLPSSRPLSAWGLALNPVPAAVARRLLVMVIGVPNAIPHSHDVNSFSYLAVARVLRIHVALMARH